MENLDHGFVIAARRPLPAARGSPRVGRFPSASRDLAPTLRRFATFPAYGGHVRNGLLSEQPGRPFGRGPCGLRVLARHQPTVDDRARGEGQCATLAMTWRTRLVVPVRLSTGDPRGPGRPAALQIRKAAPRRKEPQAPWREPQRKSPATGPGFSRFYHIGPKRPQAASSCASASSAASASSPLAPRRGPLASCASMSFWASVSLSFWTAATSRIMRSRADS